MSQISLAITVTGRVQGVWFRASTKSKADELGIAGTVRNMPDGSVYIELSGPEEKTEEFVRWCRIGPELARVDNVTIEIIDNLNSDSFQVVR